MDALQERQLFSMGMGALSLNDKGNKGFLPLEHRLLAQLKPLELHGKKLLLAVSAGVDSLAMLGCVYNLRKILNLHLSVVYVHHGPCSPGQMDYRDKAWRYISYICNQLDIPFFSNVESMHGGQKEFTFASPEKELSSESDLRKYRYEVIDWASRKIDDRESPILCLAHTANDLLETRLIRVIRGTGGQGLPSMEFFTTGRLRPVLGFTRDELDTYLHQLGLKPIQDPSNQCEDHMRNWLRHNWLPLLEDKVPGSLKSLARSFDQLASEVSPWKNGRSKVLDQCLSHGGIKLSGFLTLNRDEKGQVLARFMRQKNMAGYGQSHINEVLKRLDKGANEHKFTLLKHEWNIDGQSLSAQPMASPV